MRIDAHQHFWHPARGDYDWMPKDSETLNRVYSPRHLTDLLETHRIDGTVLVQAAATVEETEYMLGLADATDRIRGVVGWINFEDPGHLHHLTRLASHPKFVGVRPMIQDIENVDWMLRSDIAWAYDAIIDLDLTFDALGFPRHLENVLTLCNRYPDMRVVFDHCMKPQIRDAMAGQDAFGPWAKGIKRLADDTQGVCKLSGLVTEAQDGWANDDISPFARHVLDVFGPERVMWGSDWPVCRLQSTYGDWFALAQKLTEHLSSKDRTEVFGGTACRFYRLG